MGSVSNENFQYELLDYKTRAIVGQRTIEIKNLMRLTAENIINIGQKLIEVKEQLEYGTFQSWLRTEIEWSEQTARQFMQVYRWSETIENKNFVFSQIGTSALYLLAAPSTPNEARQEILDLVEDGEKIVYTRAKTIVDRHKKLVPSAKKEDVAEHPDDLGRVVDTIAEIDISESTSSNLFFRLETEDLGCIVRLYQAEELESTTKLNIGAKVVIKVGRWQGKTATISEILTDSSLPKSEELEIVVRTIEKIDSVNREALREVGRHMIVSYGDICLAVEASPEILAAFANKLKTNTAFTREILNQALDK